jgi:hypothetical protein
MFNQITNAIHAVYKYFVSCCSCSCCSCCCSCSKKPQLNTFENEYGRLPDYEPANELTKLGKLNIQIPKYQFVLLQDD